MPQNHELMSHEETRRALELKKYFVVLPAFRGVYRSIDYEYPDLANKRVDNPYISVEEEAMQMQALRDLLVRHKLFEPEQPIAYQPDKRYWPGERE